MPREMYDDQGKYWFHLVRLAGWEQKRADALLVKRFSATHWNALNVAERRQAINIMRGYVSKAEKAKAVKLRQMIMAHVAKHGQTLEWLHECMIAWGYGDSLRKLTYGQTIEIWDHVKECLGAYPMEGKCARR